MMNHGMKHLFILNPHSYGVRENIERLIAEINGFFENIGSEEPMIYVSQFPLFIDDTEDLSGEYRIINIANGAWYGGNKCPIKTAMPNDGVLDILFAYTAGALRTLIQAPFYITGNLEPFLPSDGVIKQARKIVIGSEEPLRINWGL